MAKPTIRTSTSALVQVTVEVRAGSWGDGCDLAQVYKQASESAIGKLRRALASIKAITTDTEVRNG